MKVRLDQQSTIGLLYTSLAEAAGKVAAVEIDKNLIPILEDTLSEYDNVMVINDDVMKVDISGLEMCIRDRSGYQMRRWNSFLR